MTTVGLTESEALAVRLAGQLYTYIADEVVADGPTRADDLAELRAYVHGIQRAVMAQAMGRAEPHRYRLLGSEIQPRPREGQ